MDVEIFFENQYMQPNDTSAVMLDDSSVARVVDGQNKRKGKSTRPLHKLPDLIRVAIVYSGPK